MPPRDFASGRNPCGGNKHQCFIGNFATEKIQIFSHIATCTFVVIRRRSFSIAREFAKEVSSHFLFLGCFPVISCEITSKNDRKICYV